jgi:hypothetical protein
MSYISQHWHQYVLRITTVTTICLTYHSIYNNMSYVSQQWQQYVFRMRYGTQDIVLLVLCHIRNSVVSLVIRKTCCCHCCDTKNILLSICLTYHNSDNNMSYVSQHWQQYILHITTQTTIYLTYHNNTHDILLSVLWYVWHIVVMVVIRQTYCYQCCDT